MPCQEEQDVQFKIQTNRFVHSNKLRHIAVCTVRRHTSSAFFGATENSNSFGEVYLSQLDVHPFDAAYQ